MYLIKSFKKEPEKNNKTAEVLLKVFLVVGIVAGICVIAKVLYDKYKDRLCCECDCDELCDCEECEEFEELAFDCPYCGKAVLLKAADIDYDESPVCEHCGKPFFTDVEDEEEDED